MVYVNVKTHYLLFTAITVLSSSNFQLLTEPEVSTDSSSIDLFYSILYIPFI